MNTAFRGAALALLPMLLAACASSPTEAMDATDKTSTTLPSSKVEP